MATASGDHMLAGPAPWRADARIVAWWVLLGAGIGGVVGFVVGGIGGRLLMLVLRRESPGASGLTSDAGFEMGRVTLVGSFQLAAFTTLAGAAFGAGYLLLRLGLPARARVAAATLVGATVGGATFIEPDGIDLLVLDPLWLAVSGFIALPALAAMATALLVERASRIEPWCIAPGWALAFAPALLAAPLLPALAVGGAAAVALRRSERVHGLATPARVTVIVLVAALILVEGAELIREVERVL